jgi:hypothetical protein
MATVCIQCSLAGYTVDGGDLLPLGTAQRRAIDRALALDDEPVAIMVHDADPKTYAFSPGSAPFEWMTLGRAHGPVPKR